MNKLWLKHYPLGVPGEIHLTGETLVSKANDAFIKYAKNMAFKCHGVSKTFAQLSVYIDSLAASLAEIGIKKGDKVAIIMPNIIQYPISIFAVLKLVPVASSVPIFALSAANQ